MGSTSSTLRESSSSTPPFQRIFEKALKEYKKKTRKDLATHPLAAEINGCASPEAILAILEAKARELDQSQTSDERLTKWLDPTVNVLNALSATLGQGVGLVFPPTTIIFSGIGILLVAAKGTLANRDMLVQLFERIESFFQRVKIYTEVSPGPELADALAKLMAEVLSILAVATKGMKRRRWKIFAKQLAGRNDIGDALQRFDKLEQKELLTVIAQMSTDTRVLKDNAKENEAVTKETEAVTKETKADVKEIINRMDTHEREKLLQDLKRWLAPPEPSTNYELGLRAYHKGTTTWFVEGNIFQEWYSTSSLLWIHGKPGSGKSILCSAIIQRILSLSGGGKSSVAYFYFDFRDEKKKHRHNLLPSLLFQFAAQSIPCSDILFQVYSAHGNGNHPPSDDVLMKCLRDMFSATPQHPTYIVIDAVDESPHSSGVRSPRAQVLSFIQDLVELRLANLHICITSRPEIDIRNRLEPLTSLRVSLHDETGHKEDIAKYITSEAEFIAHDNRWRDVDKELVIETLSGKADGMFRWVFCQLEMLRLCVRSSVQKFVNELPDTLDETYERVLKGIPKTNRDYAQRLLQCLAVAIRPLCVEEVAQILTLDHYGIQGEVAMLDANSQPDVQEQELLSACPSLITIVDSFGSRVVQFSHFSVKEFLMSGRLSTSVKDISHYHILPDVAHMTIAQASLEFILRLDNRVNRRRAMSTFAGYAAIHWVSHVQAANTSSRIMHLVETLFDFDKPHFAAWVRIYDMDERASWYQDEDIATPLYYAALCGFYSLVEYLIKKYPEQVNARGGKHNYPLAAALYKGHVQVADLLLQNGANVHRRGTDGRTPLHHAIMWCNESHETVFDAAQFLLEHGADANAQQLGLMTPLHLAAACANNMSPFAQILNPQPCNLVKLLLKYGANVHAEDSQGRTPLHKVVYGAFVSEEGSGVVRLLLQHGADVNKRDNYHNTPLHFASQHQHLKSVQVLLDHGANVKAKDGSGRTPLQRALTDNHVDDNAFSLVQISLVQLLVERGADVNTTNQHYVTPLHLASYRQNLESVRVFLNHGANVNAKNNWGQTSLHLALIKSDSSKDVLSVVQLLVERGADVNIPDKDRVNPLHTASHNQHIESVQVLLNHDANVNANDNMGQTPLHRVLGNPVTSESKNVHHVLHLLVKHGADVNPEDKDHVTPIHLASFRQTLEPVRELLNRGANVNAKDSLDCTPLHRALEGPVVSEDGFGVVQLLMERGADMNARNKDHLTPLHFASFHRHIESVQILLDHGANVNAEDNMGRTPLHQALLKAEISKDVLGVVQLLVGRGADVNARNKDHLNPLHFASFHRHIESVQFLLDHGANVNAKDSDRWRQTPLHQVLLKAETSKDVLGVVQLLVGHGADVNTRCEDDVAPLHFASHNQHIESVQFLLDHGANIHAEDRHDKTPLHRVLESRCHPFLYKNGFGIVQLLVERGADVNARDKVHLTPLHLASSRQHLESVRVLLDHGANVHAEDGQGRTPLRLLLEGPVTYDDLFGVLELLVERGADVNSRGRDHATPLHVASYNRQLQLVRVLLNHGANVNAMDGGGQTPLHQVFRKHPVSEDAHRVVQLLLERGADVNAPNNHHAIPLHLASYRQHLESVRVLLDHGANVHAEDGHGWTPLRQVFANSDTSEDVLDVVQLLLERGADVNSRGKDHATTLHVASRNQQRQLLRVLLNHGANVNTEDSQYWSSLHHAAENPKQIADAHHLVQRLLEHGADVNAPNKHHVIPLHLASYQQHPDSIQVLLDHGANVHAKSDQGWTPLHCVFANPHAKDFLCVRVVQRLLQCGADVNTRDKDYLTPLHSASRRQHLESVRVLLDHGANIHAKDSQGWTPLRHVLANLYTVLGVVQLLLERGADVNTRDKGNLTPLHFVSSRQRLDLVGVLLDRGAHVNVEDCHGQTPLHHVFQGPLISEGGFGVVQELVERGADVNTRTKNHSTPLHFASYHQHLESVRFLLNHGANINAKEYMGKTPLHVVLTKPDFSKDVLGVVQLLVERGADVNIRDKGNLTPLHLASSRQYLELVRVLLDHGANFNAEDCHGWAPLHRVLYGPLISEDGFGVVQILLERGADASIRNKSDITPLHLAAYNQHLESVRVLLNNGANVNAKEYMGKTPLHVVLTKPDFSKDVFGVIQLLVERGADVNTRDKGNLTPLHLASSRQYLELVRVLLDHGANFNAEDCHGWAPLHRVLYGPLISEDGFGVVQQLVERGADVNARTNNDITPLHLASHSQHLESVRVLLNNGANVNANDNTCQTPLHRAFGNPPRNYLGYYFVPQLLLKHGADVNARDEDHQTPLHLASRLGFFEGPWVLLKHGADLNVINKEGMTPFQLVQKIIRAQISAAPPGYFSKPTLAVCVVLMSLLYEY